MSDPQAKQNGEKIFPIFFKKKVMSLEKTKELQEMMKDLKQENEVLLANEKLMLDKIRIKHNDFVVRLQSYLERFKMANIQNIVLTQDTLPLWSPKENESQRSGDNLPEIDDATERLIEWYTAMATYVSLQREGVNQIISDWFSQMDKIASEGEPEPQGTDIDSDLACEKLEDLDAWSENIVWYIIFVMFCLVNVFIFLRPPEDIDQCVDDGAWNCFIHTMTKLSVFVHKHYLRFHNITLENAYAIVENLSVDDVSQCSSPLL